MGELLKVLGMIGAIKITVKESSISDEHLDKIYDKLHDVLAYIVQNRRKII
jgi:hypothetical protein